MKFRKDTYGAVLVGDKGNIAKVYRKCPHCGLVDKGYSAQGIRESHFSIWTVGSLTKYECGKCRKHFFTVEFATDDQDKAILLYERVHDVLSKEWRV